MLSKRLSASQLERAAECPASTVLPVIKEEAGPWAEQGMIAHNFMETAAIAIRAGRPTEEARASALAAIPEDYRELCEGLDLSIVEDMAKRGALRLEVGVAFNARTLEARITGEGLKHGDPIELDEMEIHGVADLAVDDGQSIHIWDWKTGLGALTPAPRNRQLRMLAVGLCQALGRDRARVALAQRRGDGSWRQDVAEMDAGNLERARDELVEVCAVHLAELKRYEDREPLTYKRGKHCTYCPSFDYCEAQNRLIRSLVAVAPAPLANVSEMAPAERARAYQAFKTVETVYKKIRAAFYSAASREPIDAGGGRVLGQIAYTKDAFTANAAPRLLAAYGEPAQAAIKTSVTKKGVKALARELVASAKAQGKKVSLKEAEAHILADLASSGGMVQEVKSGIREHIPGESIDDGEDE